MSGFSFHFLPEEDRLALTFSKEDEAVPAVLLNRRLVKMLGGSVLSGVMDTPGTLRLWIITKR